MTSNTSAIEKEWTIGPRPAGQRDEIGIGDTVYITTTQERDYSESIQQHGGRNALIIGSIAHLYYTRPVIQFDDGEEYEVTGVHAMRCLILVK